MTPLYLYYATTQSRGHRIQRDGLHASKSASIYLSSDEHYAQAYASRNGRTGVLLRTPATSDMKPDRKTKTKGDYRSSVSILPGDLYVLDDGEWIPILDFTFAAPKSGTTLMSRKGWSGFGRRARGASMDCGLGGMR